MTQKKKYWILAGVVTPPLILLLLAYQAHETRRAEVAANCQTLLGKETLEEKEKKFLIKYPGAKIRHPWEGSSHIIIPPSKILSKGIGGLVLGLHYWSEVKMDEDKQGLPGWNNANSGYDFCVFDTKNKSGCVIQVTYIFYAEPDKNCAAKILYTHKP